MPALEELLRPAKWLDEQILRQHTKLSKKFNLDEGRKKYFIGIISDFFGLINIMSAHARLGFPIVSGSFMLSSLIHADYIYNLIGILGGVRDDTISEPKILDREIEFYKTYNRTVRLPIFLTGLALSGKFGIDLFNYITERKPTLRSEIYLVKRNNHLFHQEI